VSFAAIILCIASYLMFIVVIVVYFVIDSVRKLLDTPLYIFDRKFRLRYRYIFFQTLDLIIKFLLCPADLSMGTISGTTHIKTIFSFSPGTDRHFIGNVL
jgi:hypothetical protein